MSASALLLLLLPIASRAGEPSPSAKDEINHLFDYLKASGCEFNRNGTWYSAAQAVDHLNEKYQYLLKKRLVSSAEDFIGKAASESSVSGRPYQVKCGADSAVQAGAWLQAELTRYRARKR